MPILPLPNSRQGGKRQVPDIYSEKPANAGLVFTKFVDGWKEARGKYGLFDSQLNPAKAAWINLFTQRRIGRGDVLKAVCKRQKALAQYTCRGHDGATRIYVNETRFVTGLGNEHAIENGFVWHHTLGVPYLPASGVKGLIRAWVEYWQPRGNGQGEVSNAEFSRLFGTVGRDERDTGQIGALIVFDALPTNPVQLAAEVLTPHDGGWRRDGPKKINNDRSVLSPGDWHEPVPVPFLVVEIGTEFQFSLGLTRYGRPEDVGQGHEWLQDALDWLGAGAKTSSGMGRMTTKAQQKARENAIPMVLQINTYVQVSADDQVNKKLRGKIGRIVDANSEQRLWGVKAYVSGNPDAGTVQFVQERFLTPIAKPDGAP